MATVKTSKSPMHITCMVGQPYGVPNSDYTCGFHAGIDFPASGTTEKNPTLYACVEGVVTYVYKNSTGSTPALGNQVQIYDEKTGLYYRYCHMVYGSVTLNVGDKVNNNTIVGIMGTTGNSTGVHLHLECSTTQSWQCSTLINAGESLGIPNIRGTIVEYDGHTPPIPPRKKSKSSTEWLKSKSFKIRINI